MNSRIDSTLPPLCYVEHPSSGDTVIIKRGEPGYYPTNFRGDPSVLNARLGVSDAEAAAMLADSIFGWDCPAARVSTHL